MEDVSGPMSFLGVGYLWSHVLSGGRVSGGVGHLGGRASGGQGIRGIPPKTTKAGGMHPTGMLSRFLIELIINNLF